MIIDQRAQLCDATAVGVIAPGTWTNLGSQVERSSTNATLDLGAGAEVFLVILVTTTILSSVGAGSIQFRLASDSTATIHASTSTAHWTSGLLAMNTTAQPAVTAGALIVKVSLPISATYEPFLGIQALTTTQSSASGAIDAFLTTDVTAWSHLKEGVSV